jgi:hypothetical protein
MSAGRDVILKQLEAAKLSIEAAMSLLQPGVEAPPAGGPCSHPAVLRRAEPTAGSPNAFLCRACSTLVDPDAVSP